MNEKKSKNVYKWLSIIFALFLIVVIVFLFLDYTNSNDNKKKIETLKKENEKLNEDIKNIKDEKEKKESEIKYIEYSDDSHIKIYAIYYDYIIFSYDDELYISTCGSGVEINTILALVSYSEFKNNVASTEVGNAIVYVYKMDIKTDNVSKIILQHGDIYKDPTAEAFILYKDNGLTYFNVNMGMDDLNNKKVLTDLKEIVDVKTVCISDEICEKVNYIVYTKDGSKSELEKIR